MGEGGGRPGRPPPPTRTGETGGGNGERKEPHARRPGTEGRDTQQETPEARRARGRAATKLISAQRCLVLTKSPGLPRRRSMRAGAKFLESPTQPNSARWRGCVVPRLRAAVGRSGAERGYRGRGGRGSPPVLLGCFSVILSRNRTKCVSLRDVDFRTFPRAHEPNRQGWGLRTPFLTSPRGTR